LQLSREKKLRNQLDQEILHAMGRNSDDEPDGHGEAVMEDTRSNFPIPGGSISSKGKKGKVAAHTPTPDGGGYPKVAVNTP